MYLKQKTILNKIYFHPLFLVCLLLFVMIGYFRFITYFMLLIVVHELGHIIISQIFNWNIEKIIILPFGGLTKFREMINRPLIEEFLISIAGIIFQMIFFIITSNYIEYRYYSIINYFIIIFNLIPIYPLDGSKILNVIFNKLTSFKNSILITVIISYIFIIILSILFVRINKLLIPIFMFLLIEVNKLYKERKAIFNKFLLERYTRKFNFRHKKTINNVDKMKKDYRHLFYIDNKYITENYFLQKMFDIKSIL